MAARHSWDIIAFLEMLRAYFRMFRYSKIISLVSLDGNNPLLEGIAILGETVKGYL